MIRNHSVDSSILPAGFAETKEPQTNSVAPFSYRVSSKLCAWRMKASRPKSGGSARKLVAPFEKSQEQT